MSDAPLLAEVDARGVATLTLNRPDKGNAYNQALLDALEGALARYAAEPAVRLLVLRGAGRSLPDEFIREVRELMLRRAGVAIILGASILIAFVGGEDSWDYPFFGSHRARRLIRHDDPAVITYALLRREHVAGAVFANVGTPPRALAATSIGPDYWWVPARS